MRACIVTVLLLAATAFADDYPKPAAFVNDFANQLPASNVQALETKVRAYERTTGNELAVAIVPSLNGMLVDDYARGLFHAWGVGKPGVNNGVLFVWAPHERRIRIEVGTGLTGVLTDTSAGLILQRVRDLIRGGRYAAGVNAAVDGVIQVLGTSPAAGSAAPGTRNFVERNSPEELERQRQAEAQRQQEEAQRQREEEAARAASQRGQLINYGLAAVLVVGLYMMYRRWRAASWQKELPGELAKADRALAEADRTKAQAQAALADLRKEAPEEICQRFDAALGSSPDELGRQRSDLERLRSSPHARYGQLKAVHNALRLWRRRMAMTVKSFNAVPGTLEMFRAQREQAQGMLESLPSRLTRMQAAGAPGSSDGLLQAAAATYSQALKASQEQPANWLLVYDLLADVAACLDRIEYPAMRTPYAPVRCWYGGMQSPAADAMALLWASQAAASSGGVSFGGGSSGDDSTGFFSGGDSGGSSGGGDSGGFGGGDSGGGGASSDY